VQQELKKSSEMLRSAVLKCPTIRLVTTLAIAGQDIDSQTVGEVIAEGPDLPHPASSTGAGFTASPPSQIPSDTHTDVYTSPPPTLTTSPLSKNNLDANGKTVAGDNDAPKKTSSHPTKSDRGSSNKAKVAEKRSDKAKVAESSDVLSYFAIERALRNIGTGNNYNSTEMQKLLDSISVASLKQSFAGVMPECEVVYPLLCGACEYYGCSQGIFYSIYINVHCVY
jgi:hypothetical protein